MAQTAIPEPLLINRITLRGPELERIYGYVRGHTEVPYMDLVNRYVPKDNPVYSDLNDDLLKDAMGFLVSTGLLAVVRRGTSWAVRTFAVPQQWKQQDRPFRYLLLKAIRQLPDPRQRALAEIHDALVARDVLHVQYDDAARILEWSEMAGLFAWNEEKMHFWAKLADYCGLAHSLLNNGIWLIPKPQLVLDSLRCYRQLSDVAIPIRAWLDLFRAEFGACMTAKGRMHRGLAMTLELLHAQGQIQLRHQADAARSLLVGTRRVSEVEL